MEGKGCEFMPLWTHPEQTHRGWNGRVSSHMEATDLTSLVFMGNRKGECDGERIYIHEVRGFWNFK